MTWINAVLSGLKKSSVTTRLASTRLLLSQLEERTVPATRVWSGAVDNIWTKAANWDGAAPVTGDDLVFPATATRFTSVNNFATGKTFGSITIQSSGYELFGNSLALTNGISTTYNTGVSTSDLNIQLGSGSVSVASGGEFDLNGAISGSAGLNLSGGGILDLTGVSPNTYSGTTTVTEGTLSLGKDGVVAVPGNLVVGDGSGSDAVILSTADQIADSGAVSVASGASLILNNFDDRIGSLTLTGASVATGTGTLTLGGNVTSNASSFTSTITGKLDLGGADRTLNVIDNNSTNPDLSISAVISGTGAGIIKTGAASTLLLSGNNTFDGVTTVSAGVLQATNQNSLGATSAGTSVASGATLLLGSGISYAAEPLTLNGSGSGGIGAVNSPAGSNTLSGPITLGSNAVITVASGATLTESGVISDGLNSFSLTKNGTGTLALTAANTFDGGTTIGAGTVSTTNAGALGTGTVTAPAGTSLDIQNNGTMPNDLVIGGSALTASGTGTLTLTGDVALSSDATVTTVGNTKIDFAGAISGSQSFDKTGGTASSGVTFSGNSANTYTGTTTIHTGTLTLSKNGVTAIPADLVLGDSPSGAAIAATYTAADQIADSAAVTITAGGSLNLNGFDDTINALNLTGSSVQTGAGILTLGGALTTTDAGIGASSVSGKLALPATATVSVANGSDAVDLTISAAISGAGTSVTKSGAGTLQLAGTTANTYTGATLVNTGVVELNKTAGQSATGGDLTIANGATVKLLAANQLADTGVITLTESSTLNLNNLSDTIGGLNLTGATVNSGTATLTLGGDVTTQSSTQASVIAGNLDLGGADRTFTVADNVSNNTDLSVTAVVSGTGAGLVKSGAGSRMVLSGNNTYDGGTNVTDGTLAVSNANSLGATGQGTVVFNGATLELDSGVSLAAETFSISGTGVGGAGAILVPSGNAALPGDITLGGATTIGVAGGSLSISGHITDNSNTYDLTKVGTGSLALSVANTYDGTTNINAGIVNISDSAALGTGAAIIASGASLELSNGITVANALTLNGNGFGGEGALHNSSGNNTVSSSVTLASTSKIDVASATTLDLSGVIGDGGNNFGITKAGAGTLKVDGTNTYTGSTSIDAGKMQVDGTIAGAASLNGGTLAGSGTVTGGITTVSSGTIDPGATGVTAILTSGNNVTLASGTTFHTDLNGSTPGTNYDQLAVNGTVTLTGTTLVVNPVTPPAIGDTFTLISNDSADAITGTFVGLAEGAKFSVGIVDYQITYVGGSGNDVVLSVIGLTYTWTGAGGDNKWTTASNWASNLAPTPGSDLVFDASGSRVSNNNDFANGTLFHKVFVTGGSYTISGNSIQVSHGIAISSGASLNLGINVALTANQAFDVATTGSLTIQGAISGSGISLDKTGGGILTFANTTASNTYDGSTNVIAGELDLNAASSFTAIAGDLVIGDNVGTGAKVKLLANDQISDTSNVTVNESATFDLNGSTDTINTLTLQGATVLTGTGGVLGVAGNVTTLATTNNVASTIQGPGALDLNGNTITITVADDTDIGVDLRISAEVRNGSIIKAGAGELALSGSNTYTGTTTVNAGLVDVESNNALGTSAGDTTITAGAEVKFVGSNLNISEPITINGSGVSSEGAMFVASGSTTLTGDVLIGSNNSQIGAANSSTLTINGVIDDGASANSLQITNGSTGRTVLGGSNLNDDNVVVTQGYLQLTNSNAAGDPSTALSVVVGSGATLELAGDITLPATKTIAISGVPVANTSKITNVSGNNTIQGDIPITGGNNEAFDVAGGTTLTVSGVISGSRDFDKNNTGTLILTGTNTHTGNVNVGEGTLIVNGSLATSNSVFVDGLVTGSGTLPSVTISGIGSLNPGQVNAILHTGDANFNNGSNFLVDLNGLTVGTQYDQLDVTGSVTLDSPTLSVTLGFNPKFNSVFTILKNDGADALGGAGKFAGLNEGDVFTVGLQPFRISYVGGDGNDVTLTALARVDTWTGNGGDNKWTTAANWSGNHAPVAGDQLVFNSSAAQTTSVNDFANGTIFDSIIINSAGYTLSGNSIGLDRGITTTYSSGTSSISVAIDLTANQSIDVSTGGTLNATGVISGAFQLTKSGGGILGLSAVNSYSGGTIVSTGTLLASGSGNQIGTGAISVSSGATLALKNITISNAITIGGTGVGGNGALQTSTTAVTIHGDITLSADATFANSTTLTLDGAISGAHALTLSGTGGTTFAGSVSNTYSGDTTLQGGTLSLGKTGGATAIAGNLIISHSQVSEQASDQIADTSAVTLIGSDAALDLAGFDETIASLEFTGGSVTTGVGTLTLGGNITTNAASTAATISGKLDLGAATRTLTVADGSAASDLSISAVISNGTLVKAGAGTASLSGVNTFAGGISINAGALAATDSSALGSGTVDLTTELDVSGGITLTNAINVNANTATIKNISGTNTFSGTMVFTGNLTANVATSTTLTFSGDLTSAGNFDLTKTGAGLLKLSGTGNTYNGDTIVSAGSLEVLADNATASNGTVVVADAATLIDSTSGYTLPSGGLKLGEASTFVVPSAGSKTLTGSILLTGNAVFNIAASGTLDVTGAIGDGSSSFGFSKTGAGKLVLSHVNTYDGLTTIGSGTIQIIDVASLGSSTGSTTINDGALLEVNLGSPGTITESITVGSAGGTSSISQIGSAVLFSGDFTLASNLHISSTGSAVEISGTISNVPGPGTFDGGIESQNVQLTLSGSNSYRGATDIISGTVIVANANALGTTAGGTIIRDAATLQIAVAGTNTISEPITFGSAGGSAALQNTLGTNTLSGAITLVSDADVTVSGGSLELSGVINDGTGSFGLTKSGAQTLILSAANTFDGNVHVAAGTLTVRNTAALGSTTGTTTVDAGSTLTLDVTGSIAEAINLGSGGSGATLRNLNVDSVLNGTITLDGTNVINVNAGSLVVHGQITGTGSINKQGTALLALDGSNNYSGTTTITAGTVSARSNGALSNTAVTVASGATLGLEGGITLGAASLDVTGIGAGGVGALFNALGDNTFAGSVTLTGDTTLGVSNDSLTLSGVITGTTHSLTKVGNSKLILTNSNSYSGGTTINAGTIAINNAGALGTGSITDNAVLEIAGGITLANDLSLNSAGNAVVSASGTNTLAGSITLLANSTISISNVSFLDVSGVIDDGASTFSLTKVGAGTLLLDNANTYGGGTTISEGNLQLFNSAATGTTGSVVLADGAMITVDTATYALPSGGLSLGVGSKLLVINTGAHSITGTITLTGNAIVSVTPAGGALSLSGGISGAFGLTKSGAGSLTLGGTSSYTGTTTISAGTVRVDGDISASSQINVNGGTLTGDGTIGKVVVAAASLVPGNSPGVLHSGDVTLANTSTFGTTLSGTTAGTGYSQLSVIGAVNLGGATLDQITSFIPTLGDQLRIIDNDGSDLVTGTFAGLAEGAVFTSSNGRFFRISYVGGTGNDVVLTAVATTGTVVTSSSLTAVFGQSVTLTATVTPLITASPTGTVEFYDGVTLLGTGTLNGAGVATLTTSSLSVASHSITAVYLGQNFVVGSTSAAISQVVNAADTVTQISTSTPLVTTSNYGDSITFSALVSVTSPGAGTPAGSVTFRDGSTIIGTGTVNNLGIATFTTSALNASVTAHSVTAEFVPSDVNFNTSTSTTPFLQTVNKATLTITADNYSRVYGDANPTFTATYSGFKNGEVLGTSGITGAISLSTLATPTSSVSGGPYAITAAVGSLASGNYSFSFVAGSLTVTKAALTITADNYSRVYGDANPSLTATYSGFKNGEILGTSDLTGAISLSTTATPTSSVSGGPYAITTALGTLASGNYSLSVVNGSLTITKAALTITADSLSRVYGDANPTLTASYSGFKNGEVFGTSDLSGTPGLTTTATPTSSVAGGPYTITATVGSLASGNYSLSVVNGSLTITKAALTITADSLSRVYGDANPTLTAAYSGFKNGEVLGTSDLTGAISLSTLATPTSSVAGGPYTITAALGTLASGNYSLSVANGSLTVTKAALTITANNLSRVYGDTNPTLTAAYSGFKNGEVLGTSDVTGSVSLSTTATPTSSVVGGPYAITAALGTLASGNYSLSVVNGSLTITKAALTVTADSLSRVYGDANPTLTAAYSGFKNGEAFGTSDLSGTPGLSTIATPTSSVVGGPYTITATVGSLSSGNYSLSVVNGSLTITKAALTITADSLSRVYGDANPTLTAAYSGFKNGEVLGTSDLTGAISLSTLATPSSSVNGSPYTITAAIGSLASGNYSISLVNGSLTVTKAALTITANNLSRIYGDANPTLTASYSGFKNGEVLGTSDVTGSVSLSTTATPTSSVVGGPYAITAALGTLASGNYSLSVVNGSLTITKAALTVTADSLSRVYGDANPTLTAAYSGFKNGEVFGTSDLSGTPGLTTTATPTSSVAGGPYTITATVGSLASGNYSLSVVNGSLTITKAALTITADSLSRVYGDANPTLTAAYSGFKNGEVLGTSDLTGAISLSTLATPTSSVSGSPYTITTAIGFLASGNYSISLVNGSLTVTKAALTITANNLSRIYGDANPTLTANYSGFKNGEVLGTSDLTGAITLSTTATPTSSVAGGPYAITTALGTLASGNYSLSVANGSLTITKAALTVTADSLSRVYGDANPTLTATITGFKNSETLGTSDVTGIPGLATTATPSSSVAGGPYVISASTGSLSSGNYSFSVVNGTLTVTKAGIVVTANDATREYGFLNPTFTASYAGFKNGQILATSGITGAPSLTTTATQGSPLSGNPYAIVAANGTLAAGNYSFSFVNGSLTITPAINDRPVIDTVPNVIVELVAAKATVINGSPVSTLTANVTDVDFQSVKGIAITSAPASAATGQWEYSVDSGTTWTPISGVSVNNALLLADVPENRVRFKPATTFAGFASLSYKAWDTTTGTATATTSPSFGDSTMGTAYSNATEKASVAVGLTNPVIDANGNSLFTSILKNDTNPTGNIARTLIGLLANDLDRTNVIGLAVTSADSTNGQWQYLSGTTWISFSNVSDNSALLINATTKLRFLPNAGFYGTSSIRFHAWDQSVGQNGERAVIAGTAFSSASQTAMINVIARPVLDTSVAQTLASTASSALVGDLVTGVVSDLTLGDVPGIAVTGLTGTGTWTYQIGASAPVAFKATLASALLLTPDAVIRFTPAVGFTGIATLSYRAWNPTTLAGVAGGRANASGTAFSLATETLSVYVPTNAGNTAPSIGNTTISLGSIAEDLAVNAGVAVKTLVLASNITDVNIADKKGIAVTAVDNTNGLWQFSLDAINWTNIGAVTTTNALLLADTAKVRFVPTLNYNGTATIDFKAWDGTFATSGDYTDSTVGSAFGADGPARGTITVTPVNDTPIFDNTLARYLPAITTGTTSAIATVGALSNGATDIETLSSDIGISVSAATGPGKWQYSLDGTTFLNFPKFPTLLPSTASLRFVGTVGLAGLASLTYQAWDGSSGVTTVLKADALSVAKEILTVEVGNSTPTLTGPGALTTITEDQAVNAGDTVIKLLGTTFLDSGVGRKGIAVTGFTTDTAGVWQYSSNSGITWIDVGAVSNTSALLLPETAKIRFLPAANAFSTGGTEPTLTYKAWDQTVGAIGEIVDTTDANLNAFSANVTTKITVTSVPDAPTLDTSLLQTLPITGSETVDSLLNGAVSSPESTTFGIFVTTTTGLGRWEVNTGSGFVNIATIPATSRYFLATANIRFVPNAGFTGLATLSYKAWDATSGQPGLVSSAVEVLSVNIGNNQPALDGL